jgi:hypothetical protein
MTIRTSIPYSLVCTAVDREIYFIVIKFPRVPNFFLCDMWHNLLKIVKSNEKDLWFDHNPPGDSPHTLSAYCCNPRYDTLHIETQCRDVLLSEQNNRCDYPTMQDSILVMLCDMMHNPLKSPMKNDWD